MESFADADEWERACAGDGQAFGRIFDKHRRRVFRHGYRLAGNSDLVQDIVAITFLEAWRKRSSVHFVDGSLLPWLLQVATNTARNLARGERRYRAALARLPAPEPIDPSEEIGPDLLAVLKKLPRTQQEVVALCLIEQYSEAEAAQALAVPAGTVKSRLSRARHRLRQDLHPTQHLGPIWAAGGNVS